MSRCGTLLEAGHLNLLAEELCWLHNIMFFTGSSLQVYCATMQWLVHIDSGTQQCTSANSDGAR